MRSNFNIAFSVKVFHSYFNRQLCRCLRFSPAPAMQKLQERFHFTILHSVNGFELYADAQQTLADHLHYISSTTHISSFDFEIYSRLDNFYTITDLPVDWLGQLAYDSAGITTAAADGTLILTAQFMSAPKNKCVGKINIQFEDILKWQQEKSAPVFSIHFAARATQWQYYVINKSLVPLDNALISGDAAVSFEGPVNVITPSGEQALLFTSGEQLIQLNEAPPYQFSLVNKVQAPGNDAGKKNSSRVIFKGLPTPAPGRTELVTINGSRHLATPMYVYV